MRRVVWFGGVLGFCRQASFPRGVTAPVFDDERAGLVRNGRCAATNPGAGNRLIPLVDHDSPDRAVGACPFDDDFEVGAALAFAYDERVPVNPAHAIALRGLQIPLDLRKDDHPCRRGIRDRATGRRRVPAGRRSHFLRDDASNL